MGETVEFKKPLLSKSGKRWIIVVSGLGLLMVAIGAIQTLRVAKTQSSNPSPTPTSTPTVEAVTALGRVEPQGEVIKLSPPPSQGGAKVERLLVKESDRVKVGQMIAILDNYKQKQAAVKLAQQEIKVAQANLAIIKAGAKSGEINAQRATIQRLEAQLFGSRQTNRAKIARLEAELQGEIQTQTAAIRRVEAEFGNADREFQRYQKLAQDGVLSDSDLDQRRLKSETSRESVAQTKANFRKTVNTLKEQIQEAKADAIETEATLNQQIQEAKANLARISEVRAVDVEKAQAEVERALASLQEAKANLTLAYITAPNDGQIIKIYAYPGEKIKEDEGIAELGRTNKMMVIAEIYESDITKVRVGQKATIKSENGTFPGEIQGTVNHIGLKIGKKDVLDTDPAADVDVRIVEVKILLTPESSRKVSALTYAKVLVNILP